MGCTEGSAHVSAGYGVAVRLLSLIRAGVAFTNIEHALAFLAKRFSSSPLEASAPPNPSNLRCPVEVWEIVRAHLIALALVEAEQELLRVFVDNAEKQDAYFDPRSQPSSFTAGGFWPSVDNRFPNDLIEWLPPWREGVVDLAKFYGLNVDLAPFRPKAQVQGYIDDYTVDSAILLQLPLKGGSLKIETYTGLVDGGFGCLGLPKSLPLEADRRFEPLIKDFSLEPVDIRFKQARFPATVAVEKREDTEDMECRFAPDDIDDDPLGHFPAIPLNKIVPRWHILCVTTLQS